MDKLIRETMLAGMDEHEMCELIVYEMRRRDLLGCVYMVPIDGGKGAFGATLGGVMKELFPADAPAPPHLILCAFAVLAQKEKVLTEERVEADEWRSQGDGWDG